MTTTQLKALFSHHSDAEFLFFHRIAHRCSQSPDLHALLLLDALCPGRGSTEMIIAAEHHVVYLRPSVRALARVVTEEQVIELLRCGVLIVEDRLQMGC